MKLAQALIERKATFERIADLRNRVNENCTKVQGEESPENPVDLLAQLQTSTKELGSLIVRINNSNNLYKVEGSDETISEAIVRRDMLKLTIEYVQQALANSTVRLSRGRYDAYGEDKVKIVTTMDVSDLRKKIDELSKEYRELDTYIQAANWSNDLID